METDASLKHCAGLARSHAYGKYLSILKAPPPLRPKLLALLALEVELRLIPVKAREELIAHMRYAWWRESLETMAQAREHPVLIALRDAALPAEVALEMVERYQRRHPQPEDAFRDASASLLRDGPARARWEKSLRVAQVHHEKFGAKRPVWLACKLFVA